MNYRRKRYQLPFAQHADLASELKAAAPGILGACIHFLTSWQLRGSRFEGPASKMGHCRFPQETPCRRDDLYRS